MDLNDPQGINDILQRSGVSSDKRKRNEAIRSGVASPDTFASQYSKEIAQAEQPSEFWGAGRKEAANQNVDSGIFNLFQGPLAKHGNQYFYYGDNDYSTAQFGTEGYNKQDIGGGKYNILGKDNVSLGTGYYDPNTAWKQLWSEKKAAGLPQVPLNLYDGENVNYQQYDEYGQPLPVPTQDAYGAPVNTGGGALEDWEILGQLLNNTYGSSSYPNTGDSQRFYSNNQQNENITGLNTLFGSSPLIYNNKLMGYKMDMNPNNATGDWGFQGADKAGLSRSDNNGNTRSISQIWRDINSPEQWSQYGQNIGDGNFFAKADQAANLPGWKQNEKNDIQSLKKSGLGGLGKIFSILGPLLSFTPLAPLGLALSTINSLANDNPLGALLGLAGPISNLASTGSAFTGGGLAGGLGKLFGAGSEGFGTIGNAALNAGIGGLGSLASGGNFGAGALGSGLGSLGGSLGGGMFGGDPNIPSSLGKFFGSTAGQLAGNSLFNQNKAIAGSEAAGRSGGLSALLNAPIQEQRQQYSPEEIAQMQQLQQRQKVQQFQQALRG